jgi:hypothetical protein
MAGVPGVVVGVLLVAMIFVLNIAIRYATRNTRKFA